MRTRGLLALGVITAAGLLAGAATAGAAPLPLTGTLDLATDSDIRFDGPSAGTRAGFSVAPAGDVNGDGATDVVIGGALFDGAGRKDAGAAWVVFGDPVAPGPRPGSIDLGGLGAGGFRIDGAAAGDEAGFDVAAAGDINGDGLGDVLVGARLADPAGRPDAGAAYVVFGAKSSDPVDLAALGDRGIAVSGPVAGDQLGFSVASSPDLNGDGRRDLILGAPRSDAATAEGLDGIDTGTALVVFTPAGAGAIDGSGLGAGGFRIDASVPGLAGWSVASVPDSTGDGLPEILIGAPFTRPKSTFDGAAYVVYGKAGPEPVNLGALGEGGYALRGAPGEVAGGSVAAVGDLDGDGRADLGIAGQLADVGERIDAGHVYLVPGRAGGGGTTEIAKAPGVVDIAGAAAGDQVGATVSGVGDYNGDGRPDVVVGAPFADPLERRDAGAAYVVFGAERLAAVDLSLLGNAGVRLAGAAADDYAGRSSAGLGDLTGDKRTEVFVGSLYASPRQRERAGAATIVLGPEPPRPEPPLPPDPGADEEVDLDHCRAASNVEAIIDDSGSMSDTDPLSLRARALKILLTKPRNSGEQLGAVEFGTEAAELFFPLTIGGQAFAAERDRLLALVDERIQADHGSTNYNAGFEAAIAQNPTARARIFLTDGAHNEGEYAGLHRTGPKTFVIGLGIGRRGVDARRLQRIADQTGGTYYPSVGAEELQPVLNAIDSRLNCDTDLSTFEDVVTDDGQSEQHSEALGDGTNSSDVTVSWDDPQDEFIVSEIEYVDGGGESVARFSKRRLARVFSSRGRAELGSVAITGARGESYATFRVTGIKEGRLRFRIHARTLKGRGSERVITQVAESRRRR